MPETTTETRNKNQPEEAVNRIRTNPQKYLGAAAPQKYYLHVLGFTKIPEYSWIKDFKKV